MCSKITGRAFNILALQFLFPQGKRSFFHLLELPLTNIAKATYENIRKLCSSVFSRKQTLKFAPATIENCDASIQLLVSGDSTSLCAQTVETQSLLKLPVGSRGNKDLAGQSWIRLQESLSGIDYIIIVEYSMFGWVDRRCKQAPGCHDKLLGNKSVIFCGDPAQLPPVTDKPIYHAIPANSIGEQGYLTYQMLDKVVKLNISQHVQGDNPEQIEFRSCS